MIVLMGSGFPNARKRARIFDHVNHAVLVRQLRETDAQLVGGTNTARARGVLRRRRANLKRRIDR